MSKDRTFEGCVMIGVLIVLIAIFVPHLFIWSVNTLFATGIEHSLLNWFAALILIAIVSGSSSN